MSDGIPLPSLEQIEATEKQRLQAIESLQISDSFVKCQNCGVALPLLPKMTCARSNDEMRRWKIRLNWMKTHGGNASDIKQAEEEIKKLSDCNSQNDKLTVLPLHSSACTGFRHVCGECFERFYKRRKKR